MNQHRLFLIWLLYGSIIGFLGVLGYNLGYIQVVFSRDLTYISYAIATLYIISETYMAFRIIQADREIEKVKKVRAALVEHGFDITLLPNGMLKNHVQNIIDLMKHKRHDIDQRILLDSLHEELHNRNYGNYCGEIAIRLGLVGTVVGLILAFLPFIDMAFGGGTFDPSLIQIIVTQLMIGISAAFFTTAAGLILGTFLSISGRIYDAGVDVLQDQITVVTETIIIPALEERYAK